ncbi:hypothetical protein BDV18DRAFT_158040 [Aspergillus unguis]
MEERQGFELCVTERIYGYGNVGAYEYSLGPWKNAVNVSSPPAPPASAFSVVATRLDSTLTVPNAMPSMRNVVLLSPDHARSLPEGLGHASHAAASTGSPRRSLLVRDQGHNIESSSDNNEGVSSDLRALHAAGARPEDVEDRSVTFTFRSARLAGLPPVTPISSCESSPPPWGGGHG